MDNGSGLLPRDEGESSFSTSSAVPLKRSLSALPVSGAFALVVFGLWGCLSIYASRALGESPLYFVERQLLWLILGTAAFFAAAAIPFRAYRSRSGWLLLCTMAALLTVLLFGVEINGMKGWFRMGEKTFLQPSEFCKVFFILWLCVAAERRYRSEWRRFLTMALPSGLLCLLVMRQPDLGTALLFFLGFLSVYWVAGGTLLLSLASLLAFSLGTTFFVILNPYALDRIMGFLDPGGGIARSAWHVKQFQYAMAQGGLTGSEAGCALWSNAYLPLPHTDSLYASIVESSGMIGGWIVILAFVLFAFGLALLSRRKGLSKTARCFIFCAGLLYVIQALLHIGVNSVLLPTTGVTLPVLSYGGSSLLSTMLAFGMICSASRSASRDSGGGMSADPGETDPAEAHDGGDEKKDGDPDPEKGKTAFL